MSVQSEKLYEGMNYISEEFIEEAAVSRRKGRRGWIKYAAVAACVCVVAAGAIVGGVMTRNAGSSAANETTGGGDTYSSAVGLSGYPEGTTYDSYAGPVFPLTIEEDAEGISAERTVTWDFTENTSVADTGTYTPLYNVTDSYILANSTDGDITVTAVYPYAGTFRDTNIPTVTVDGTEIDTGMAFSAYSGGFVSADGDEDEDSAFLNFDSPNSWDDYKSVLSDEGYFETDTSDYPELSQVQGGSYDYYCESGGSGVCGYDMVTTFGSRLEFSAEHAHITNCDNIEIVSQNFGFDIENGVTSVELDLKEEHYYMDVRCKED